MNVSLLYAAFSPILIASVAFYGLVTLLYVYLLMKLPLSKAYTFSLFGSALVPLLAYTILGETLSLRYIFALAIVVAGLVLMHG
jgi:undecaprenyl phosphate-alpha-L-ara4N flippase subunit ArnE